MRVNNPIEYTYFKYLLWFNFYFIQWNVDFIIVYFFNYLIYIQFIYIILIVDILTVLHYEIDISLLIFIYESILNISNRHLDC